MESKWCDVHCHCTIRRVVYVDPLSRVSNILREAYPTRFTLDETLVGVHNI